MSDEDVVWRLRHRYSKDVTPALLDEAADEIERLRALNDIQYVRLAQMEYVAREIVERLRAKVDELELAAELLRNDILEMGERDA